MEIISAYDRQQEFCELVTEYTDMIQRQGEHVKQCLASQRLDDELKDMEKKYGLPYGRMYLALASGKAAGCAALTRTDDDFCEIKRLYVRPQYRGLHIGGALVEQVMHDAREIGYKHMRLDTFPFMKTAIRLYQKYSFYYIGNYNGNPAKTAVFMQADL